jgi:hypothetical protein
MESQLTGSHRHAYDALFQHPVARNLQWRDVWSMLGVVAEAVEGQNGNLKVTRNGQTLVLHRPRGKDLTDAKEVSQIRNFLERSVGPKDPISSKEANEVATDGKHLLVVLDHREARVYKTELHGAVPQKIRPYNPHGFGRHLHYVQDESNGQRKPERLSFYQAIVKTLEGAEQILLFGRGTGASSAMEKLLAELKEHHAELAKRVVGSVVVDEQHLTRDQLLAKAREIYAGLENSAQSEVN